MNDKTYILLLALLFVAGRFFFAPLAVNEPEPESEAPVIVEKRNHFDDITLDAAAVYVYDLAERKPLFERNAHTQLPLASLTKLMTALVALETLEEQDTITIDVASLLPEGDHGLIPGERFSVSSLIEIMLVASSNDSAHALAGAVASRNGLSPLDRMNTLSREIGLDQSYFVNETGLDVHDAIVGGAYGSAADVAKLLEYIMVKRPDLLEPTREGTLAVSSLDGLYHEVDNTNEIVNAIPWLIGAKTGFTDLAGGNLAVVFDAGLAHPIAVVVLGATMESRFSDVEKIVSATFAQLRDEPIQ